MDEEECWHCGAHGGLEYSRYKVWRCINRQECRSRPRVIHRKKFDGPWTAFLARFEPEMYARLKDAAERETALQQSYGCAPVSVNDLVLNAVSDLLERMENAAWEKQERASG